MSRGFVGSRAGGGASTFKSLTSPEKRREELMVSLKRKKNGERETEKTQEQRYQKLVEEKMAEIKTQAMKSAKYSAILPGAGPQQTRELSKSAQDVIEKMAQNKAKKHAKKNMFKDMKIRPRLFTGMQGGRIDKKGRIYGPDGRYIAYVDKKTGKVKARGGSTICFRYTDSSFCDYKIIRFIQWQYDKKRMKNSIYAVNGFTTAGGGVYGSFKDGAHGAGGASGGVWGNGGGWGNTGNSGGGGVWGGGGGWGGDTGGFWG